MPEPFELVRYIRQIVARWPRIAAVCGIAAVIAFGVSKLLPRQYDATVTLVIQPASGGGNFPATISPVYLEYLRTYEQFVQTDALLSQLIRELGLDQPPHRLTIERLRNSVLKVSLMRHTKLLRIRARFPDAAKAHMIALTLARLASQSNASVNSAETDRSSKQVERDLAEARVRQAEAQAALEKFRRESRNEELSRAVIELLERKLAYEGQLSELQINLADKEAQLASLRSGAQLSAEIEGLRARARALRSALSETSAALARNQMRLAPVDLRRQELEHNLELAQRSVATFTNRANDARATVAARNEELLLSDSGTVPTQPSAPRTILNVLAAMFIALIGSLVYETWVWNAGALNAFEDREMAAMVASSRRSRLP